MPNVQDTHHRLMRPVVYVVEYCIRMGILAHMSGQGHQGHDDKPIADIPSGLSVVVYLPGPMEEPEGLPLAHRLLLHRPAKLKMPVLKPLTLHSAHNRFFKDCRVAR
jgi:hypothetical protein